LVFALLSGITGFFTTWGFDAVSSVSLTMNKAMIGSFGLLAIILMIWIRARYDPDLWEDRSLRATYVVLGLMGSATAIVTGSLGGGKPPYWERRSCGSGNSCESNLACP
jgi:hypothetical protein